MNPKEAKWLRKLCESKYKISGEFVTKIRNEIWAAALAEGPNPVAVERVYGTVAGLVHIPDMDGSPTVVAEERKRRGTK